MNKAKNNLLRNPGIFAYVYGVQDMTLNELPCVNLCVCVSVRATHFHTRPTPLWSLGLPNWDMPKHLGY